MAASNSQPNSANKKTTEDSETARLLYNYSSSIQNDIRSRNPKYGSLDWKSGPPFNSPNRDASSPEQSPNRDLTSPEEAPSQNSEQPDIPFFLKAIALSCALLLAFGSHYSAHALGTLKSALKENLGINNTQYGILQSSVALVNTILPVLGGVFVDKFGAEKGSLLATFLITLGSAVVASSASVVSFPLMILGRTLYGLGSGSIVIVQGTIISQWFHGQGLSLALGLKIAASRIASFLAMATVFPITEWTGFYGYALWFAAILCVLSLLANILYVAAVRIARSSIPEDSDAGKSLSEKKGFKPSRILGFPLQFWLFALISFTLGASWNTFLHFNTELVQLRFGADPSTAGAIASTTQLMPLFLPPLAGLFQDRLGGRLYLVVLSAILHTVSMVLLGFTELNPLIGMILFSSSLALGPACLLPAVTILVPSAGLGTALGLYKSSMNVSASFQDLLVGWLQPDNPPSLLDDIASKKHAYDKVMAFMVIVGIISIILSLLAVTADNFYNQCMLNLSAEKREKLEKNQPEEQNRNESQNNSTTKHLLYNKTALGVYAFALIGSWVIFTFSFIQGR